MEKVKKLLRIIVHPKFVLMFLSLKGIIRLSDITFLKYRYKYNFNKELDLMHPSTFNEKLQWLKLYNRKDIYTTMVDKYEVKKYVANIIGEEYIIPTIGIYDKFEDINFDELPSQFVMKCTHDSGGLVIVDDKSKMDINEAKRIFLRFLKRNYYYTGREWPYKNVKPRIIIEKYMIDSKTKELRDYKFFCFNGVVKFFKIDFDRFIKHKANYYDVNGKILPFGEEICPPDQSKKLDMPKKLDKMLVLAEKLSKNIPFLRVDFYEINDKVYFGELTFYPASGFGRFIPEEWDKKIGELIDLSLVNKDEK